WYCKQNAGPRAERGCSPAPRDNGLGAPYGALRLISYTTPCVTGLGRISPLTTEYRNPTKPTDSTGPFPGDARQFTTFPSTSRNEISFNAGHGVASSRPSRPNRPDGMTGVTRPVTHWNAHGPSNCVPRVLLTCYIRFSIIDCMNRLNNETRTRIVAGLLEGCS